MPSPRLLFFGRNLDGICNPQVPQISIDGYRGDRYLRRVALDSAFLKVRCDPGRQLDEGVALIDLNLAISEHGNPRGPVYGLIDAWGLHVVFMTGGL